MFRLTASLLVFAALSAWAGAQGPAAGITAAERLQMLRTNRMLIENMVDHGLDMAGADTPLKRAAECRRTARTLANAVRQAGDEQNAGRVAELCGHLDSVMRDALAPNLELATRDARPGSPDESELKKLRATALTDFDELRGALPAGGTVGGDAKVKEAFGKLESLRDLLK
ncbi:MAG TPA: hypothetical protein VMZ71_14655 [Gemmataceae bacterium]|nr:hypothetical protein [Gemmataceae bacterium]